jgi:hypothetical protein
MPVFGHNDILPTIGGRRAVAPASLVSPLQGHADNYERFVVASVGTIGIAKHLAVCRAVLLWCVLGVGATAPVQTRGSCPPPTDDLDRRFAEYITPAISGLVHNFVLQA